MKIKSVFNFLFSNENFESLQKYNKFVGGIEMNENSNVRNRRDEKNIFRNPVNSNQEFYRKFRDIRVFLKIKNW